MTGITAKVRRINSGASTPEPETAMSEPLYGHDLLGELRMASAAVHGAGATYCNCSGDSFDFDGVIAFLGSKGKVRVANGTVSLGMAPACQH
jgi:hypothetical protein